MSWLEFLNIISKVKYSFCFRRDIESLNSSDRRNATPIGPLTQSLAPYQAYELLNEETFQNDVMWNLPLVHLINLRLQKLQILPFYAVENVINLNHTSLKIPLTWSCSELIEIYDLHKSLCSKDFFDDLHSREGKREKMSCGDWINLQLHVSLRKESRQDSLINLLQFCIPHFDITHTLSLQWIYGCPFF
jgi:hypothetical protein